MAKMEAGMGASISYLTLEMRVCGVVVTFFAPMNPPGNIMARTPEQ